MVYLTNVILPSPDGEENRRVNLLVILRGTIFRRP